jgi:hypothetical protein
MAFLMLVLSFVRRHLAAVIIAIIAIIALAVAGYYLHQSRKLADDYARQLANYDVVTQLHEGAYLQQTAQLELAETLIREYSPQPRTDVAYQAVVKVVYRTRTITVPVTDGAGHAGDDHITVTAAVTTDGQSTDERPDICPACPTVTGLQLTYEIKPLAMDLFITRGPDGKYQTIVDTHNPDLVVEMQTKLDPKVFQDDRHWFIGGGPLVRIRDYATAQFQVADLGVAVHAGYAGARWFVAVQGQYLDGFGVGLLAGGRL